MQYLTAKQVVAIHNQVINPHELQGEASHKSIEAVVARVENRLTYGLIADVFDLAACYAACIAVGHAFNDANKRTAFAAMDTVLALNNIDLSYEIQEAGNMICQLVLGRVDECDLAEWLRGVYNE